MAVEALLQATAAYNPSLFRKLLKDILIAYHGKDLS